MGGGGRSTTETRAEFPPEFRPLASAAVNQILGLQSLLPVSAFAQEFPIQSVGLAPHSAMGFRLAEQIAQPGLGERAILAALLNPAALLQMPLLQPTIPAPPPGATAPVAFLPPLVSPVPIPLSALLPPPPPPLPLQPGVPENFLPPEIFASGP